MGKILRKAEKRRGARRKACLEMRENARRSNKAIDPEKAFRMPGSMKH